MNPPINWIISSATLFSSHLNEGNKMLSILRYELNESIIPFKNLSECKFDFSDPSKSILVLLKIKLIIKNHEIQSEYKLIRCKVIREKFLKIKP